MLIFKLVQTLFEPLPFCLLLLLVGTATLSVKKINKKIAKGLIIAGFILLYIFSLFPISSLLLSFLESQYLLSQKSKEKETSEILVLFLGGERGKSLPGFSSLSESTIQRTICLADFYLKEKKEFQIMIFGTDPLKDGKSEAQKAKDLLLLFGLPKENIFLETKSRTTFENARAVKKLIGKTPFFLFTSAFHLPRSMKTLEALGAYPIPIPCDFRAKRRYNLLDFFPNAQALGDTTLAIHEYLGIIFYPAPFLQKIRIIPEY